MLGQQDRPALTLTVTDLSVSSLGAKYGPFTALDDVSFDLNQGVTALVGVNGAGKSTLLRILAGAQRPSSGSVTTSGGDPHIRKERRQALTALAFMPQEVSFPSRMTAAEVVSYVGWMRGLSVSTARKRARDSLGAVDLTTRADDPVKSLSGGMVRRLALAQALVAQPEVLLLDEPSTGLDPQQRRLMIEVLQELDGCVLLSSHVMEDVADLATRVLVLNDGRLRFDDSLGALRALAPDGTPQHRTAERGFLEIISTGGDR